MKRTSYGYDGFIKCNFDYKNLNNATIKFVIGIHSIFTECMIQWKCIYMNTLSDFDPFMVGDEFILHTSHISSSIAHVLSI